VFIDETWTKTNMAPLRGWAPRGQRIKAKVPHGRWQTMTFMAALRHDRITAPWFIEGPINGESFLLYIEKVQGQRRATRYPCRRRPALLPAEILTRSEPDRAVLRQVQTLAPKNRTANH